MNRFTFDTFSLKSFINTIRTKIQTIRIFDILIVCILIRIVFIKLLTENFSNVTPEIEVEKNTEEKYVDDGFHHREFSERGYPMFIPLVPIRKDSTGKLLFLL